MCKHISGDYRLKPEWFLPPVDEKKTDDVGGAQSKDIEAIPPDSFDVSELPQTQDIHELGSVNAFIQANREAAEQKSASEVTDGRTFDITTSDGVLEMLTESVQGEIDQFVEYGLKETLDRVKDVAGTAACETLAGRVDDIRNLRREEARFVYEAIEKARNVLKELRGEGVAKDEMAIEKARNVLKELREEDVAKDKMAIKFAETMSRCEKACDALRRAVRNFRYNYDQVCHAQDARHADVSWTRKLRQFFSASHTQFFAFFTQQKAQHFGEDTIQKLKIAESDFVQSVNRLLSEKGRDVVSDVDVSVTSYKAAEQISETLHQINEANRQLNGDNLEIYQLQAAKAVLEDIARNGGSQEFEVSGGAGFGFALPTRSVGGGVMGKVKHVVRVSGRGDGSVKVDVFTMGEIDAKMKAGFADLLKVKGDAHGGRTIPGFSGRSETFTDVDSAAQYLASGDAGWAAKLSAVIAGRGTWEAIKMMGASILPGVKNGKKFDERAYVKSMKERNVFKACDAVLRRRRNTVMSERKTFSRWGGGVGGGLGINVGEDILRVGVEGRVEGSMDFGTGVRYRTYLVDLEETHVGKLVEFYRERHRQEDDEPKVTSFVPPKDVLDFLKQVPESVEEKTAMRQTAIRLLHRLQTDMESWEDSVNASVNAGKKLDHEQQVSLAASYRDAAQALAAIAEKWNAELGDGDDERVSVRFRTLYDRLRANVQNPGVAFSKDEFLELMEVKVATVKADQSETRISASLELDFLKKLEKLTLGLEGPLADAGLSFVTESLRGLTTAAIDGGLKRLGLKGELTYEDILTSPKTGDKRPWANAGRETMNFRMPNNLMFGAVAAMIVHRYLAKHNLPVPEKKEEIKQFGKAAAVDMLITPLKRLFFDLKGHLFGGSGAKSISDKMFNSPDEFADTINYKPFLETFKKTGGYNFQLNWEDDRLVSVAVGKHEQFDLNVGLGHIGPILEFGVKFDRVANTDVRLVENASFNSIASICDRHLRNDNVTGLLMFGAHNRRAFARIYNIIAAVKSAPSQSRDEQFLQDCEQFDLLMKSFEEAVAREGREVRGNGPLAKNYKDLQKWLQGLHAKNEEVDDDRKMRLVVDFFKFVSYHYSLAERNVKEAVVEDNGRLDGDDMLMVSKIIV